MSEQDAAEVPKEKPALQKRGTKNHSKPLSALFTKAFDTVTAYVAEIQDGIISRTPMTLSNSRLTPIDYYLAFQSACRAADLNRGLQNKLKKLLRGDIIGNGARAILTVRLTPLLMSKDYCLYPKGRFFVAGKAWSEGKRLLCIPQTAKKAQPATEVMNNCTLYFNAEGKPQTVAEVRSEQKQHIAVRSADVVAEAASEAAEEARLRRGEDAVILASYNAVSELSRNGQYPDDALDFFERQHQGLELDEFLSA